jgi:hypothetical protein
MKKELELEGVSEVTASPSPSTLSDESGDHEGYKSRAGAKVESECRRQGFFHAQNSKVNPSTITNALDVVYGIFMKEQQGFKGKVKDLISQSKSKLQDCEASYRDTEVAIESKLHAKESKEAEIEELRHERIDWKSGEKVESSDSVSFVTCAFIVVMLTLFLFVFYSSVGYSAFYGIKPGLLGFINPDVFVAAGNKGKGILALTILFPLIFLGLGFFIHTKIEAIKKSLTTKGKIANLAVVIGVLSFTFSVDAIIGYIISRAVYINEFNAGLVEASWESGMIWSDITFYLILVLGFATYILWGLLVNYVLSHPFIKPLSERTKLEIAHIDRKIAMKNHDLEELTDAYNALIGTKKKLEDQIEQLKRDIVNYTNGLFPVDASRLKALVGHFMGGYQAYANEALEDATELINEADSQRGIWLETKIKSLTIATDEH